LYHHDLDFRDYGDDRSEYEEEIGEKKGPAEWEDGDEAVLLEAFKPILQARRMNVRDARCNPMFGRMKMKRNVNDKQMMNKLQYLKRKHFATKK
jgi:hypothetical protein